MRGFEIVTHSKSFKEEVLFKKSKLVFDLKKILSKRTSGNRCSPWGSMHLLLYLVILKDIEKGQIFPDSEITFTEEVQREFGALRSTKGIAQERRLLSDILNQAISFNAPDCIIALCEVYGGVEKTQIKIKQLASQLNISFFSRLSITGRSNEVQLTNIYDYYKIGREYLKLSPVIHQNFIKNRRHIIHGKDYEPPLDFDEDYSIVSSIFWGTHQSDCFIFRMENQKMVCSLVMNGKALDDTVNEALNDVSSEETELEILEKARYSQSFDQWVRENFSGYFLNERILKEPIEVDHLALDMPIVKLRDWKNVCIVSLAAKHYRSLIPSTSRSVHSNSVILKSDQKDRLSLIITDSPILELRNEIAQYIVPDSLQFCYEYISYMSECFRGKTIGITGSAGKSSTRLILSHLLSDKGNVLENISNANLHYPTFSLSMDMGKNYDYLVFEGAASSMNALAYGNNSYLWRPDVAIITSFGSAHAATGIKRNLMVKSQIFYGVKEGGFAVINGDISQEYLEELLSVAKSLNLTILLYSLTDNTLDCYLKNKIVLKDRTMITINLKGKDIAFQMKTDSDGQIQNAMASLLALECIGIDVEERARKLVTYESFERILRPKEMMINEHRVTVIDDTHNSSIEATINGINHFSDKRKFYNGSSLLVLGEVADLGNQAVSQHKRLEEPINAANADKIIFFGTPFESVELATHNAIVCETKEQVVQEIEANIEDDSLIFIKGSHGIGFYEVVDMLKKKS